MLAPERAADGARTSLRLRHPRAGRNIRSHWVRDVIRVLVLVTSDLAVFVAVRGVLRGLRAGWLGDAAASTASALFPQGFLGGWQFFVALVLSLVLVGSYGAGDDRRDAGAVLAACYLAALIVLYDAFWTGSLSQTLGQFAGAGTALGVALVTSRLVVDRLVQWVRCSVAPHRALLVMHGRGDERWRELAEFMRDPSEFVIVDAQHLGEGDELRKIGRAIDEAHADTVLVLGELTDEEMREVTDIALASACRLLALPRSATLGRVEPRAVWVNGRSLVELNAPSLHAWQLVIKRIIDVACSLVGLVLLSPVMLAVAIAIKLDSRGPVLFGQVRLGGRGRPFRCLKFRSMRADAEEVLRKNSELYREYLNNHFKLPEARDPRLTPVGRFLRKTSLDELPQLVNVLLGQMSLVGPRPIVPDELDHYGGGAPLLLSSKPGITGAWAVSGRSGVGYPDRAHMELQYIRNWSVIRDLGILFRTIPAVLRARGAH